MCGIAGFYDPKLRLNNDESESILQKMADSIVHRGPDAEGLLYDQQVGVGFAHRRLSIQDLSDAGHQPMTSDNDRFVLVFNGEIYNHLELRKLLGVDKKWKGHSDTESLVALFECYGVEHTLDLLVGMFAIVLWDCADQLLYLIRDRFGEKPLYYGEMNGALIFGSELKALREHPYWQGEIDYDALAHYFKYSVISGKESIYKGVNKVEAGEIVKINIQDNGLLFHSKIYWSIDDEIVKSKSSLFTGSFEEATELVRDSLDNIIHRQLLSDVPVGVFLSGGVDSRLISLLAQQELSHKLKTFTVGFDSVEYDESKVAKDVSEYLRTEHYLINFSEKDMLNLVHDLPSIYDEPFADATQMPAILLSRLTKGSVSVALSGEGGDELFGGYNRYIVGSQLLKIINRLPMSLRVVVSKLMCIMPPSQLDNFSTFLRVVTFGKYSVKQLSRKLFKLSSLISSSSDYELFDRMRSFWKDTLPIEYDVNRFTYDDWSSQHLNSYTFMEKMMIEDTKNYLQDDLCVKVDRAAMSIGLETRLPFLDHNLFSLVWRMPSKYKHDGGIGKPMLRKILADNMPSFTQSTSKQGFSLPLAKWLREGLRDWAGDLLSEDNLIQYDFLDKKHIKCAWKNHLSERDNCEYDLWNMLMFLEWDRVRA